MILAIIAVVPLLLERIYTEETDREARVEEAYAQALVVARQGAAAQNEAIVSARGLLQVIASARATFNASNNSCNLFLTRLATPIPWIKSLSVADKTGHIVCTSFPEAIGLDISDRPHFKAVMKTGEFVVSDYFVGPRINAPVITAALPQIGPDGSTNAVLLGLLDLSWFEQVAKTFMPPSASMLMIDGAGIVLAQYPGSQNLVGQNVGDHPLVRRMLDLPEGFVTDAGLDGVRRIFGHVQLPGTHARIAVGFGEKEVLARANRAMWTAIAEFSAVAVLVLLGIWFGGERLLVRPIRTLASTASRIGRGDVKMHATDLPWAAEFVPLAVALDDMAGQLNDREQELRDSNSQLRELAQIDGLTGLPNRRSFNERLGSEWLQACKLRQPMSVLMIDVDFFKKFNDHYGHVQGDTCLRKVARVLTEGVRGRADVPSSGDAVEMPPSSHRITGRARVSDFAARYGGEEFAVLLRGANLEVAMRVGERLRAGVEELLMAHTGAPWGFVSISVGAASVTTPELSDPQSLTEAADGALYEAKRQGRNRVAAAAPMVLSRVG